MDCIGPADGWDRHWREVEARRRQDSGWAAS
jgi:hypothetical protein